MYVTLKEHVPLVNNSDDNKVSNIMYVTPKEQALPANDSDSDKSLFSSENVTDNDSNDSRSSEEALINYFFINTIKIVDLNLNYLKYL
jgi:hypothetical protein